MDFDLQEIKKIDRKSQYLVFGFVKKSQSLFSQNDQSTFWNISELIIYTIIAFYAHIEFFKHFTDGSFKTENNATKITRIVGHEQSRNAYRTVYGSKVISFESKGIHTWKIRLIAGKFICIGIDEASHECMEDAFFFETKTLNYSYAAYGGQKYTQNTGAVFLKAYRREDVVTMVLNMNDKTISFAKNDGTLKEAFVIKESTYGYSLAVFIRFEHDCVELLSYDHVS